MEKGDVKVIFLMDYSNRKKDAEGIFSEDIAKLMVEQGIAKIVAEKEPEAPKTPQPQPKKPAPNQPKKK